jgi:hypothetical protein
MDFPYGREIWDVERRDRGRKKGRRLSLVDEKRKRPVVVVGSWRQALGVVHER